MQVAQGDRRAICAAFQRLQARSEIRPALASSKSAAAPVNRLSCVAVFAQGVRQPRLKILHGIARTAASVSGDLRGRWGREAGASRRRPPITINGSAAQESKAFDTSSLTAAAIPAGDGEAYPPRRAEQDREQRTSWHRKLHSSPGMWALFEIESRNTVNILRCGTSGEGGLSIVTFFRKTMTCCQGKSLHRPYPIQRMDGRFLPHLRLGHGVQRP